MQHKEETRIFCGKLRNEKRSPLGDRFFVVVDGTLIYRASTAAYTAS